MHLPLATMYMSTEDARSDFLLAAVVYVIGPGLVSTLLRNTGSLLDNEVARWLVAIAVPLLTISAMPLWLMRYRGEGWRSLLNGTSDAIPLGVALAVPVVLGTLAGDLVAGTSVADSLTGQLQEPVILVGRVLTWLSVGVLVIFLHHRAEYAFRPISEDGASLAQRAAIAALGTAVVATLLLLIAGASPGNLLAPLGVGVAYLLATRVVPPGGMWERWQAWSPLIVLALGSVSLFSVLGQQQVFLITARTAGMVCGLGLVAIMALQARKGGRLVLVLTLLAAVLSSITISPLGNLV